MPNLAIRTVRQQRLALNAQKHRRPCRVATSELTGWAERWARPEGVPASTGCCTHAERRSAAARELLFASRLATSVAATRPRPSSPRSRSRAATKSCPLRPRRWARERRRLAGYGAEHVYLASLRVKEQLPGFERAMASRFLCRRLPTRCTPNYPDQHERSTRPSSAGPGAEYEHPPFVCDQCETSARFTLVSARSANPAALVTRSDLACEHDRPRSRRATRVATGAVGRPCGMHSCARCAARRRAPRCRAHQRPQRVSAAPHLAVASAISRVRATASRPSSTASFGP